MIADVEQGYLTVASAGEDYGVVIDRASMTVDADATWRLCARGREPA